VPTILTHPAVPLAIGFAVGSRVVPGRLLLAGAIASVLPDADVLAFRLGISYSHDLGHRGATHSVVFALILATLAFLLARPLRAMPKVSFLYVLAAAVSHPLLDMITNGGLGAALWWPASDDRLFFPVQVVEASPLSLRRFFGAAAVPVLKSELWWVWLPCSAVALAGLAVRRSVRPNPSVKGTSRKRAAPYVER
jgi:inner membrane protein